MLSSAFLKLFIFLKKICITIKLQCEEHGDIPIQELVAHSPSRLISGSAFFAVLSAFLAPSGVESLYLSAAKWGGKHKNHQDWWQEELTQSLARSCAVKVGFLGCGGCSGALWDNKLRFLGPLLKPISSTARALWSEISNLPEDDLVLMSKSNISSSGFVSQPTQGFSFPPELLFHTIPRNMQLILPIMGGLRITPQVFISHSWPGQSSALQQLKVMENQHFGCCYFATSNYIWVPTLPMRWNCCDWGHWTPLFHNLVLVPKGSTSTPC